VTSERRRRLLVGILSAAGLVAVVAVLPPLAQRLSGESAARRTAAGTRPNVSTVHTIQGIDALRTAFNEDAGRVRLYLLLSPT
jgi:hypothetical protein